ncbi:MAG: carboxypeptidase regulatory-like domain-containing protein, partial [Muribaculaceae bacterium]|nr:carboxypeptidase regulatory-like domain-containing protein [Muribaculaceae bacterium]
TIYTIEPGGEHEHEATLEWTRLTVPVPEYAGKTCRLRVVFNQPSGPSFFNQVRCMADDVEIGTKVANDLRATSLTGNSLLESGKEYTFTATIENLGSEPMSDYSVELVDAATKTVLNTAPGVIVEPSGKSTVALKWTPGQSGSFSLNAVIVSDSDPVSDNNTSYTHHLQVLPEDNTAIGINHGDVLAAMAYPINFYAVESATQSIYPANEIGTTRGVINSIVFTSYLDSDFYGEPFEVFVAETDRADFGTPEFVDPQSFTKVFEGAVFMPAGTLDVVIPFDTPYSYNGGNIVVMCRKVGKEFVMGKYFIIHKSENPRSIQCSSNNSGTFEREGYVDAEANCVYPQIRFNIVKADAGKVAGVVSDENGPVADALVRIAGTQRVEQTDAQGRFSFPEIAVGDCAVEVSKHGYHTLTSETFNLAKDESKQLDLKLVKLPRHTVSGTVTAAETGQPVRNVQISLSGYDDFVVFTDDAGAYTIKDVAGSTGSKYSINVSNGYFKNKNSSIDVDGDKTLDFVIEEKILRAHNVKANVTDGGVMLTWESPMPEFRHDSGEPHDYIGWTHGTSEVIVGAAFHKKALVKEISWFVTDRYGAHRNFNVYIFGLDEEGKPNAKDLLYIARNVEFTDNAWSTHILGTAVEADGFMIAVGCDGFMGIGICEPTEEYPFAEGECYYAGDSYNMTISNMSSFAKVHPMLRAYGEDLDSTNSDQVEARDNNSIDRPAVEYKVLRGNDIKEFDSWTLIGSTKNLNWYDTKPASEPSFYAVVASYATGDSEEIISNIVGASSLGSIIADAVKIGPNPMRETMEITGAENIASLSIVAANGQTLMTIERPGSQVNVSGLSSGIYFTVLTFTDNSHKTVRIIKE